MSTATVPLVRVHWHHPEWVAVAVATVGWLGLAALATGEPSALWVGTHRAGAGLLAHAALMAAAMMAPLVTDQVHHLAVSSLWSRRYRAVVGYLTGYLAVWSVVGAVIMTGLHAVRPWVGALPLVAVTGAVAVVVAGTEGHLRRLRRCGAGRPLALAGWRADRDCVVAGVQMAGRCVATTWAVMLAVMAQGGLLVLAAATVLLVLERRGVVPERRLVPWTLAVAAAAVVLSAVGPTVGHAGGVPVGPHVGH